MGRDFQPKPICGNCNSFRRSVKDVDKVVLEKAKCAKGCKPERVDEGDIVRYICEEFGRKDKKRKKPRKIKPWQRNY